MQLVDSELKDLSGIFEAILASIYIDCQSIEATSVWLLTFLSKFD
jgi:dsRNA-specific ribonuclease